MSNAQDLGLASSAGGNFLYEGPANYTALEIPGTQQGSLDTQYNGMAINSFMAVVADNVINSAGDQQYIGYSIDFGGTVAELPALNAIPTDNQPVLTWFKDQQIYYKLSGFNPNTLQSETWIIAEEIVPRPETFDPTGNFPSVDHNVYFKPPSGNNLVNIRIVGRWIQ